MSAAPRIAGLIREVSDNHAAFIYALQQELGIEPTIVVNVSGGVVQGASSNMLGVSLIAVDFSRDATPDIVVEDEGEAEATSHDVLFDLPFVDAVRNAEKVDD